jgi:hypothetical protein
MIIQNEQEHFAAGEVESGYTVFSSHGSGRAQI